MKKFAAFLDGSGVRTFLTSSPAVVHGDVRDRLIQFCEWMGIEVVLVDRAAR